MSDSRRLGDPGTAAFKVEKYPFFLLNRLVGQYNMIIEPRLRSIGLDIPRWRVLMILGESSPRAVARIAEFAVINISTATRIIQRMTAAGLVACEISTADNRVTQVSLTARGDTTLGEARRITAPIYAAVIGGFSAREFDTLISLLGRLESNLRELA